MEIIKQAVEEGRKILSEYESKKLLAHYGIPVTREIVVESLDQLKEALNQISYPLVLKAHSSEVVHKTEKGLVHVDIRTLEEAESAFQKILKNLGNQGKAVLVQEMVKGQRELVVGLTRDNQFGPCVMFGLGGIFTEILKDVSFRVAPIEKKDALEMMKEIKAHKILEGIRGMPPADIDLLAQILIKVGKIGLEVEEIKEIDINPIILHGGSPVAVDALVVLESG